MNKDALKVDLGDMLFNMIEDKYNEFEFESLASKKCQNCWYI